MKFFYTLFLSLLMCTSALATNFNITLSNYSDTENSGTHIYTFDVTADGGYSDANNEVSLQTLTITPKGNYSELTNGSFYVRGASSRLDGYNIQITTSNNPVTLASGTIAFDSSTRTITLTNGKVRPNDANSFSFTFTITEGGGKEPDTYTIDNPTYFDLSEYNALTQRLIIRDAQNTVNLYYNSTSKYGDFDKDDVNYDYTTFSFYNDIVKFDELDLSVKMSPALKVTGDGTFKNGDKLEFSYAETELNVTEGVQVKQCKYEDGGYAIEFGNGLTQICLKKNASDGVFAGNDFDLNSCASAYVTGTDENYNFTDLTFTLEGDPASDNGWAIEGSGTANGVKVSFSYSNIQYLRTDVTAIIDEIDATTNNCCETLTLTDNNDKKLVISYAYWEGNKACAEHKSSYDGVDFKELVIESSSPTPFRRVTGYGVLSTTKETIAFVGNQSYDLKGTKLVTNIHSGDNHTITFGDGTYNVSIAYNSSDFAVEDHTEFTSASFINITDPSNPKSYEISDLKFTTTGDAASSWSISGTGTLAYGTKISFSFATTVVNITTALYATYYNEDEAVQLQYDAEAYVASVDEEGKLHFDAEYYGDNLIIPAKTPVVLHATQAGPISLFPTSEEGNEPTHTNQLVGAATDITVAEMEAANPDCLFYAVTLDKNDKPESAGFYWVAEEGAAFALGAGKAYLPVKVGTNDAARGFSFADALGISDIKAEKEAGVMYNIYGQRVQEAKGLVVRGGKMMFVK